MLITNHSIIVVIFLYCLFLTVPSSGMSHPSAAPTSTAKSIAGPSIAKHSYHRAWIGQLLDEVIPSIEDDRAANSASVRSPCSQSSLRTEAEKVLMPVEDLPLKMQSYANSYSLKPSPEQAALQKELDSLPRAMMAGAPDEANHLCLLLDLMDAKTVVEVGVFRGITTLAFALCLRGMMEKNPEAGKRRVIGLDVSEDFAEVGKKYWKEAGVDDLIDFRLGDARETLSRLQEEMGEGSVDLCFIDADKTSYDDYYEKCVWLTKPGGLICVDNTLWGGRVLTPHSVLDALADRKGEESWGSEVLSAQDTRTIKRLTENIYSDDRIERVSFLTIADGVIICRRK